MTFAFSVNDSCWLLASTPKVTQHFLFLMLHFHNRFLISAPTLGLWLWHTLLLYFTFRCSVVMFTLLLTWTCHLFGISHLCVVHPGLKLRPWFHLLPPCPWAPGGHSLAEPGLHWLPFTTPPTSLASRFLEHQSMLDLTLSPHLHLTDDQLVKPNA